MSGDLKICNCSSEAFSKWSTLSSVLHIGSSNAVYVSRSCVNADLLKETVHVVRSACFV